jgi:hypothetical protein
MAESGVAKMMETYFLRVVGDLEGGCSSLSYKMVDNEKWKQWTKCLKKIRV